MILSSGNPHDGSPHLVLQNPAHRNWTSPADCVEKSSLLPRRAHSFPGPTAHRIAPGRNSLRWSSSPYWRACSESTVWGSFGRLTRASRMRKCECWRRRRTVIWNYCCGCAVQTRFGWRGSGCEVSFVVYKQSHYKLQSVPWFLV